MAQQAQGQLEDAIQSYQTGVDKDANNAQCKQLLERAEEESVQRMMAGGMGGMGGMPGMGGMGGMPGMGGMGGMGGPPGGQDGPFSKAKLEAIKTNPKFAAYF